MSLPWEAEKISAAFNRAHSMSLEIISNSKEYADGIKTTLEFLPFDFDKHSLFIPNKEEVTQKLMAKTGQRLERLMKELVKNLQSLVAQLEIMRAKKIEIEKGKDFSDPNVLGVYYSMENSLKSVEQELENLSKTQNIKYFS